MIVVDSRCCEQLGPGEQRAVLAHELGHILSDHVLYMTALDILMRAGGNLPGLVGLPVRAVQGGAARVDRARPSSAATAPPRWPSATPGSSAAP